MSLEKIGVPKKRLPEKVEGVARFGKVLTLDDNFFTIGTRHHGNHTFWKKYSKNFEKPSKNERVYLVFYGHGKKVHPFAYKVISDVEGRTLYEE